MNRKAFDIYCKTLPAVTHVVQWHGTSVWKIGGKIFAICGTAGNGNREKISLKCSDTAYDILCERSGIIPAPYLARAKWVQLVTPDAMDDDDIKLYIQKAYDIIVSKLTKSVRKELGL